MSTNPTISVILPAYNAARFLAEAIESILNQTFKDFELILINDGSHDQTKDIMLSYKEKDARIVILDNDGNRGLSYSFNHGIEMARGKYIARMDADDVSLPNRFRKQVSYLERHPKISILGSSMIQINEKGDKMFTLNREPSHALIKFSSLFSTPIYHPTIMAKAEILKSNHYNEGLSNSEDYELWSRLLFNNHIIFGNIKRPLLLYRAYPGSFTQTINLDKRSISAHNTISNLRQYTSLTDQEKRLIVMLRQERVMPIASLFKIFSIYFRVSGKFIKEEGVTPKETLRICRKILSFGLFLAKHYAKHH